MTVVRVPCTSRCIFNWVMEPPVRGYGGGLCRASTAQAAGTIARTHRSIIEERYRVPGYAVCPYVFPVAGQTSGRGDDVQIPQPRLYAAHAKLKRCPVQGRGGARKDPRTNVILQRTAKRGLSTNGSQPPLKDQRSGTTSPPRPCGHQPPRGGERELHRAQPWSPEPHAVRRRTSTAWRGDVPSW